MTLETASNQDPLITLKTLILERPESFLHASPAINAATIGTVKELLDPIVGNTDVLDQIHVEAFNNEQIWSQIRLVSDAVLQNFQSLVASIASSEVKLDYDYGKGIERGAMEEMDTCSLRPQGDAESEEYEMHPAEIQTVEYTIPDQSIQDTKLVRYEGLQEEPYQSGDIATSLVPKEGKFGVDDELFFSIDDFNKQTDIMDANYVVALEDDEVDYNADPDEQGTAFPAKGGEAPAGIAEDEVDQIRYEDFFAPPARPYKRSKTLHSYAVSETSLDHTAEQTIKNVEKDLFSEEVAKPEDLDTPQLSNHAKRQAKLAVEIRQLEEENVSKRDWTLLGEASAKARPKDSLLEEDLDFERLSKPVPVVTIESTKALEEVIKERIITGRFDTVIHKLPYSLNEFTRPSFFMEEGKSSLSLADSYAQEVERKRSSAGLVETSTLKLEAKHREIQALYHKICHNLDSLSSWHYVPKPGMTSIEIVANVPAIQVEDAQPQSLSAASRLAAHELYVPQKRKGEILTEAGLSIAKSEMAAEETQRRRRNQRAKAKKGKAQKARVPLKTPSLKKDALIASMKQGNVRVIKGSGDIRDISGKPALTKSKASTGPGLKL